MAGENVASPSTLQPGPSASALASSQPISVASPTGPANANSQQQTPQLAVNLAQRQNFPPNQQIGFSQQQPKPGGTSGVPAARPLHPQYIQNVQNSNQQQSQQQVGSPAMIVQSPPQPGASSIPRSSSAARIVQTSSNTAGLRTAGAVPTGLGSQMASFQQQQQQQQMLAATQRASQSQAPQQRPTQSGQSNHMQSTSPSLIPGSTSMRPLYSPSYTQMGRPALVGGGQMPIPQMGAQMSQQQIQQMQAARHKGPSQFLTSTTTATQLHLAGVGSISGVGSPLVRPSSSAGMQSQPAQRMQPAHNVQTQPISQSQLSQQQSSSQQKQKLTSMTSYAPGLVSPSQAPGGPSNPPNQPGQQAWMQKPLNQMSAAQATYQASLQQPQKSTHIQYATRQMQGQQQQAQLSQMNHPNQPGRVQSSSNQRPPTPTGIQLSGFPGTAALTSAASAVTQSSDSGNRILGKRSIQELVAQVDPSRRLDPEVEDMLLDIADDFIESVTTFACKLAKHRKSNVLEAKDVLLHLNRNWDINIPGFGGEEYHTYKKMSINETHKQRLALIKKSIANQQAGQDPATTKASGGGGQPVSAATVSQGPTTA